MAYFELEPWGCDAADLRAGIVAATIANVHRGKRGGRRKPKDFMPNRLRREPTQQTADEIRSVFDRLRQQWDLTHRS